MAFDLLGDCVLAGIEQEKGLMLQAAPELALDGGTAAAERGPAGRLARDHRVQRLRRDPR